MAYYISKEKLADKRKNKLATTQHKLSSEFLEKNINHSY
jgi:hypothetical protein